MSGNYDEDDYYEDGLDDFDEDNGPEICSPVACGDCWMGDGLCEKALERQASEAEDYAAKYVRENVSCPICNVSLTQYEIPADDLWAWPGLWPNNDYYSPIIALTVFAAYGAPKGEVHESVKDDTATYHHIWVGTGEFRSEELIRLTGIIRSKEVAV